MLVDGLSFTPTAVTQGMNILSGPVFPSSSDDGDLFILTTASGQYTTGLYYFNAASNSWEPSYSAPIEYKGAYSATVTYPRNAIVTDAGSTYKSIIDSNVGKPLTDTVSWVALGSAITYDFSVVESTAGKGAPNGYTPLDANAKVPTTYLPDSIVGALKYNGVWNPATNIPPIPEASSSNLGHYYVCSADGTTTVSGHSRWVVGDWIVSNGTSWDRVANADAVVSINGRLGAIVLTKNDVGLTNVDNTADLDKPISTAVQAALNGKVSSTAIPYDIASGIMGKPGSNSVVFSFVVARAFTLPANFTGSYAKCGTPSTATQTFTVRKNGTSVGTLVFAAGATSGTFTVAASVSLVAGDVLSITNQSIADTTFADCEFTLVGSLA